MLTVSLTVITASYLQKKECEKGHIVPRNITRSKWNRAVYRSMAGVVSWPWSTRHTHNHPHVTVTITIPDFVKPGTTHGQLNMGQLQESCTVSPPHQNGLVNPLRNGVFV